MSEPRCVTEILVQTGQGDNDRCDETRWCVGIAVDPVRGQLKDPSNPGLGRILLVGIDIPEGETAADRRDIVVLFKDLPEPIDLELDLGTRTLYWTDRRDPPRGNTSIGRRWTHQGVNESLKSS